MSKKKKRKWTVFFLVKSVGGNMPEVIRMMNDIRCLEFGDHINVIVCLHFMRENLDAILQGNEDLIVDISARTLTTMFFRLKPVPGGKERFSNELQTILEEPGFDITNPLDLEVYFRRQVLLPYRAKHYILFTWDHGRAYGIFSPLRAAFDTATTRKLMPVFDRKTKILTMEELDQAIRLSFHGKKIDVVIMLNCNMQFFDAGYALRHSVKYLVAPEGSMDFEGYNYHYLFHVLNSDKDVTPRKIAKLAVKSFVSKVYVNEQEAQRAIADTALFATDLRYYDSIAEQIEILAQTLLDRLPADQAAIMEARNACLLHNVGLIDFYKFTRMVAGKELLKKNFLCASRLLSIKDLIVIQSEIGKETEKNFSGFSIFFPMAIPSSIPRDGFDNFFETSFMKRSKWKTLIERCVES